MLFRGEVREELDIRPNGEVVRDKSTAFLLVLTVFSGTSTA